MTSVGIGAPMRARILVPRAAIAILFGCLLSLGRVNAEDMPLPLDIQTAMFKKIFSYDRALAADDKMKVLVVHADNPSEVERVVSSFTRAGVSSAGVSESELAASIRLASVVYVLPGVSADAVKSFCARNGVLSISGVPSLAEQGHVSIGLGAESGKPKIIINLNRVKRENHELSAQLLELSKIVR